MREKRIAVFLSHVMNLDVGDYRADLDAVRKALSRFGHIDLQTWEDSTASAEDPRTRSLRKVQESDILLLLLGNEVTEPVEAEVTRALEVKLPLWVFVRAVSDLGPRARALLKRIKNRCTYREYQTPAELTDVLVAAVNDETQRLMRLGMEVSDYALSPWRSQFSGTVEPLGPAFDALARSLSDSERKRLEAEMVLAKDHVGRGRYSDAYQAYSRLRSDPSIQHHRDLKARVLNNHAAVCWVLNKKSEALASSEMGVQLSPGNEVVKMTHLANIMSFQPDKWQEIRESEKAFLESSAIGLEILASDARERGSNGLAADFASRALALDPKSEAARLNLAYALEKEGKTSSCRLLLEEIAADSRFYVQAQVSLAELDFKTARHAEDWGKALSKVEKHLGNAATAAAARGLQPDDWREQRAHMDIVRAGLAVLREAPQDAIAILQSVDQKTVPAVVVLHNLGQAYVALDEWQSAIDSFRQALQSDPQDLDVLHWLCIGLMTRYSKSGDASDLLLAEEHLRRLYRERPSGLVVLNLAEILGGSGRISEAKALIQEARTMGLDDVEVDVAELQLAWREGDDDVALSRAKGIYERCPTEVTAALFLGKRSFEQGDYRDAVEKLEKAVADPFAKCSSHPEAFALLARSQSKLGRTQKALETVMSGLRRYPKDRLLPRVAEEISNKQA